MKRKTFLIQVFLLLFTFQSIWNVAEAACLHEMPNVPLFLNEPSFTQPNAQNNDNKQSLLDDQKICFNDRCSHLSNHIALELETQSDYNDKPNFQVDIRHALPWVNFYQSPYLPRLAPPPELSPLAVG